MTIQVAPKLLGVTQNTHSLSQKTQPITMHLKLLTQQVTSLLEMGETRKGIDKIVDYVEGRDELRHEFYDKAIQIKARYLRAKRQVSMQLIDDEAAHAAVEQVHIDIATLLVEMDEKLHPSHKSNKSTRSAGFTLGGGIAVALRCFLLLCLHCFLAKLQNYLKIFVRYLKKILLSKCSSFHQKKM